MTVGRDIGEAYPVDGKATPEELARADAGEQPVADAVGPVRQALSGLFGAVDAAGRGLTLAALWLAAVLAVRQSALAKALRRGAAELLERESRLKAILETAPEAIVVVDDQGVVETANPAAEELFGYRACELVGMQAGLLLPPPGADGTLLPPEPWASRQSVTAAGLTRQGRRKDGSRFPLELAVGEFTAGDCKPCCVLFVHDLSARERMEAELRQAYKMEAVGQLTGGIAHDFNNLLTVVLGNLELLAERLTGEQDLLLVGDAKEAAHAGAELTGQLLAFARRQPLIPRPLDLCQQLEEAVALLRRTLNETIEVRALLPAGLPAVLADPGQLQNAILNLAFNARDAMPKGGVLAIRAAAATVDADHAAAIGTGAGDYVLLLVTDTGAGMPPELSERAFEPFFTTKAVGAGTGLGLAMVYGFAKQSGGHVEIESASGHGTTVRLYLPQAALPVQEHGATPAPTAATAPTGRGETILVVEDDARLRRYAANRLESLGYRVREAEDGPAAMRVLNEPVGIDLMFTDIVMPGGMTGCELAEWAQQERPSLLTVLASGFAEPELLRHGLPADAKRLPKPYTTAELATCLRQALDTLPRGAAPCPGSSSGAGLAGAGGGEDQRAQAVGEDTEHEDPGEPQAHEPGEMLPAGQ